VTINAVIC